MFARRGTVSFDACLTALSHKRLWVNNIVRTVLTRRTSYRLREPEDLV